MLYCGVSFWWNSWVPKNTDEKHYSRVKYLWFVFYSKKIKKICTPSNKKICWSFIWSSLRFTSCNFDKVMKERTTVLHYVQTFLQNLFELPLNTVNLLVFIDNIFVWANVKRFVCNELKCCKNKTNSSLAPLYF